LRPQLPYLFSLGSWGYEFSLGPPRNEQFKHGASVVPAAARELITVSKYRWGLLHGSDPEAAKRQKTKKKPRRATIPSGLWPRRMSSDLAAAYCGEKNVDTSRPKVLVERRLRQRHQTADILDFPCATGE
jgi:hypothetical protein